MAAGRTQCLRRVGITLLVLAVLAVALGRGFAWMLRRRPKRLLGPTRKLFGRVLNPLLLWLADRFGFDQPVLYHIGRSSGREYATPLCVSAATHGFIVPAAFGPDTDWMRNLRETPHARLSHQGNIHQVEARMINAAEALEHAGGLPGCPCWTQLQVQEFVLLEPVGDALPTPERSAE